MTESTQQAENERQTLVAIRWKAKHPEFKETGANVAKIREFFDKNYPGGAAKNFHEETLEKVFQSLKAQLDLFTPDQVAENATKIREGLKPPTVTLESPFFN